MSSSANSRGRWPTPSTRRPVHRFRQAEVEHLHRAVGADFDIGGLQIAMDDALLVGRFEGFGDLFCYREAEGTTSPLPTTAPWAGRVYKMANG